MKRIGIVGVGLLGSAVAERLLGGGFEVTGYDTRPDAVTALAPRGLKPAKSVADCAAGADAVFTILPSLAVVEAVYFGPGGLLETAPRNATLIQMSTISPELTRTLGQAAAAKGFVFLDTPMSGTSQMVARGDCVMYVGGDRARAEACRPLFDAIGRKTFHVGEVGQAMLAKLVTNLLVGLNTAALAEALVLAVKGGLDPVTLVPILRESAGTSRMVDVRGPMMAERSFAPQMKIDLFLKDFQLMLDAGLHLGAALPLTSLTQQLTAATQAAGHGGDDLAAILTTFERLAGIPR